MAQFLVAASAWADTTALSFSGGSGSTWDLATIGWEFTITSPINVTSLGVWDENGDGLTDSHQVGIWLSTGGSPLVTATVTTTDPLSNGFRYKSISPFTLQPGTYVIGSYMPSGADLGSSGATFSTQAPVAYTRNLFLYDSGFTIPTDEWVGFDGGNFGPNFQFNTGVTVPTLNEWGMIIFMIFAGFASVYLLRRRRGSVR
ncbi:MAG: IPTL-CTERM sorting domain-containing protein [Nitrospiraceae bacterium]|nr:IPTL-CTERM sorting domain-containing protein [Nitrospiraceae bacterium]